MKRSYCRHQSKLNYSVNIGPRSVVGGEGYNGLTVQTSWCTPDWLPAHWVFHRLGAWLLHRLKMLSPSIQGSTQKIPHHVSFQHTPLHPLTCDCINPSGPLLDRPHIFCDVRQNQRFKKILSALWIPLWRHVKQLSCSVSHWGNLWRSHVSCKSIKTPWSPDRVRSNISLETRSCFWKIQLLYMP